ncbi:lysophospholipid acyltransferase family protein [Caulobacter sp. ErkDOM-E]|uniref:lysophospholipid acyltransferase family protein n=1 Tax=Caulobacter sp. ErkDOM-E TaxID=3402778 RepID=UPI003AF4E974
MRPLRSPWVMSLLVNLMSGYLALTYLTLRWTREGQQIATDVQARALAGRSGVILALWHSRVPVGPATWPQGADKPEIRVLVSQSRDGEFIARVIARLGLPSIRGSSLKKTDTAKNKGGEQAFRDMVKWVKDGGAMAITPDGPRGPVEVLQKGAVALARVSGAPVLFVGVAMKPCLRLGTWDRTIIPLPFARAAMVWDGPATAGRDDDPDALAEAWGERLSAVSRRAETLVGEMDGAPPPSS